MRKLVIRKEVKKKLIMVKRIISKKEDITKKNKDIRVLMVMTNILITNINMEKRNPILEERSGVTKMVKKVGTRAAEEVTGMGKVIVN